MEELKNQSTIQAQESNRIAIVKDHEIFRLDYLIRKTTGLSEKLGYVKNIFTEKSKQYITFDEVEWFV